MKQPGLVIRHWRSISLLFHQHRTLRTQLLMPARGTESSQTLPWGLIRCKSRFKPIQSPTKSALTYQHWLNYITLGKKIQVRYKVRSQGEGDPCYTVNSRLVVQVCQYRWAAAHLGALVSPLCGHFNTGCCRIESADLWTLCVPHKKGLMRRRNPGRSSQKMSLLRALTSLTLCC